MDCILISSIMEIISAVQIVPASCEAYQFRCKSLDENNLRNKITITCDNERDSNEDNKLKIDFQTKSPRIDVNLVLKWEELVVWNVKRDLCSKYF